MQQEIKKIVAGSSPPISPRAEKSKIARENGAAENRDPAIEDASVGYAVLAREVDTNRELYNSVLERMKEVGVAARFGPRTFTLSTKRKPRSSR